MVLNCVALFLVLSFHSWLRKSHFEIWLINVKYYRKLTFHFFNPVDLWWLKLDYGRSVVMSRRSKEAMLGSVGDSDAFAYSVSCHMPETFRVSPRQYSHISVTHTALTGHSALCWAPSRPEVIHCVQFVVFFFQILFQCKVYWLFIKCFCIMHIGDKNIFRIFFVNYIYLISKLKKLSITIFWYICKDNK